MSDIINDYAEILYCITGNCVINDGGNVYSLNEGDMIVISLMKKNSFVSESGSNYECLRAGFEWSFLYRAMDVMPDSGGSALLRMKDAILQRIFTKGELSAINAQSLLLNIRNELACRKFGFEAAVRSDIVNLLLRIFRYTDSGVRFCDEKLPAGAGEQEQLRQIFEFVYSHYFEDITVKHAAKACNLSYSYFSRQFKKAARRSFTEYLNMVRITEAERLLLNTDMSITEIAMNTGYSDTSYFSKCFRKFKNVSPTQLRKNTVKDGGRLS